MAVAKKFTNSQRTLRADHPLFHAGLRPLHAVQALTRGGVPLADATHALSLARAAIRNPAKTAILTAAQVMGLPTLPVRLAAMGWALARDVVRVLSR